MRRFVVSLLAAFLFLLVLGWLARERISLSLAERIIARNLATSVLDDLPDGLHVALCGAGSPLPDPDRSGPCVAVIAGEKLFIVDTGSGSSRSLARMRIPQGRIDAILLTHFHSDHIDGLGELLMQRWVNGTRSEPTPVHGPRGVEQVVSGFNRAYAQDGVHRVAHHGEKVAPASGAGGIPRPFATPGEGTGQPVLEEDGLTITAFRVEHEPVRPAVGYRFDYGGRSLVVSGDTAKSANLQKFAEGVDVLVHEALSPRLVALIRNGAARAGRENIEKVAVDIVDYHTSPVEAAEIARDAGARHLVFYHVVPPLPIAPLAGVYLDGVDKVYEGGVTLGRDGTFVSLPSGSDAIELTDLL